VATQALHRHVLVAAALVGLAGLLAAAGSGPAPASSDRSVRFSKRQLFVGPHENATVGDLNRDGHPDIVSGAYWFAGPDFVARTYRPNHLAKEYHHGNSEHVYDVDGDGWPDIIVGGWGADGISWYRNPGRGAAERGRPWEMHEPWEARLLARTRGTMEMFALHDYDGDGTPELHSANYRKQEPLEVWRFTKGADGQPALQPFVLGAEGGGHGFAWGDVNGDGREDVLTEIGWYERQAGDPFAAAWRLHRETALPHPSCPVALHAAHHRRTGRAHRARPPVQRRRSERRPPPRPGRPERAGAVGVLQRRRSRCGRRDALSQGVPRAWTVSTRPVPRSRTAMPSPVVRTSSTPPNAGGTSVRKIWNVVESRGRTPIHR
jgi:FG-GAP-like repeat